MVIEKILSMTTAIAAANNHFQRFIIVISFDNID